MPVEAQLIDCISLDLAFPVKLEQHTDDLTFRVTYGNEVVDRLSYEDAARNLGECVMHALACNGKLQSGT